MLDHVELVSLIVEDAFESLLTFVFTTPVDYSDKIFPLLYADI